MITQEQVKEIFSYEDGKLFWRVSPCGVHGNARAGYERGAGYRGVTISGKNYREHRIIFLMHEGYLPPLVDHINGVRDDNRIENLRACTASQNGQNRGAAPTNTSGVKGVQRHSYYDKWVAKFKVAGKTHFVGTFDCIHEAEKAIRDARAKLVGEFANHG